MRTLWSIDEIDYLKNNYGVISTLDIAKNINRSYSSVLNKATILNLKISRKIKTKYKYKVNHNYFKVFNNVNS